MENRMINYNNLPWGFTFNPTDEEIMRYLKAKADNIQLPFVDPIVEFDIYTAEHPSQLCVHQRVNASHMHFYVKKSGRKCSAGNGYWNVSSRPVDILSRQGVVIGQKRLLVYHQNSKKRERSISTKTKWTMDEYRLPDPHPTSAFSSFKVIPMWTLCKIGETGRTFGVNQFAVPLQQPQQQQVQQFDHNNVELVPQGVSDDQTGMLSDDDYRLLVQDCLNGTIWDPSLETFENKGHDQPMVLFDDMELVPQVVTQTNQFYDDIVQDWIDSYWDPSLEVEDVEEQQVE